MESKVIWKEGMAFEAQLEGFSLVIDASPEVGGKGLGPRPKGLTLTALAGCTAMDVVSILQKGRVAMDRFEVSVDGTLAEEHPKRFLQMTVTYRLWGRDIPADKVQRAVQLSEEKYCGVSATLAPTVTMKREIWVNDQKLG